MEGWVGLVGWPIVDTLPTEWSHVNHRSGVVWGQSATQKTDVLTRLSTLMIAYVVLIYCGSRKRPRVVCDNRIHAFFQFVCFWSFTEVPNTAYCFQRLSVVGFTLQGLLGFFYFGNCMDLHKGPVQWQRKLVQIVPLQRIVWISLNT